MPLSERGNQYDGVFLNQVELHCLCSFCVYYLGRWLGGV